MRSFRIAIPLAATMVLTSVRPVHGEMTSVQEALTIAQNYVALVLVNEGDWGGFDTAEVAAVQEFTRGERTLGYFCEVHPRGFLIVSLHKELAPVKAYSVWSDLDAETDEGLTDLLKDRMECILDAVEKKLGRPLEPDDEFGDLLEVSYRATWDVLAAEDFHPEEYQEAPRSRAAGMNYQERDVLLTTDWHQQPPYNQWCPDLDCSWPDYNDFNENARVGCVATAGAQIMRHWCWPPYGDGGPPYDDEYDWPNMCREFNWDWDDLWFLDENGVWVTWEQINAVAELCRDIGLAVEMEYGCGGSGASVEDMVDVYESHYRYSTICQKLDRSDYEPVEWFDLIKAQVNLNRPVQYRYPGHSIVGDGWKEEWIGDDYYWYHMNYGWPGGGYDTWYALDELHNGDPDNEYMIRNIIPVQFFMPTVEGDYPQLAFPYRYFSTDVEGISATVQAGQHLQVLKPGFLLRNTGSSSGAITFYGESSANTVFFLHGDPDAKTRIRISGGALSVYGGGEMVIY